LYKKFISSYIKDLFGILRTDLLIHYLINCARRISSIEIRFVIFVQIRIWFKVILNFL